MMPEWERDLALIGSDWVDLLFEKKREGSLCELRGKKKDGLGFKSFASVRFLFCSSRMALTQNAIFVKEGVRFDAKLLAVEGTLVERKKNCCVRVCWLAHNCSQEDQD